MEWGEIEKGRSKFGREQLERALPGFLERIVAVAHDGLRVE